MGHLANSPFCGPLLILFSAMSCWDLRWRSIANLPICGLLLIVLPTLRRWGAPNVTGYVANLPAAVKEGKLHRAKQKSRKKQEKKEKKRLPRDKKN